MKISKTYSDGDWVSVTTGAFKGRIGSTTDFRESDNSYRLQLVDGESPDVRWNPSEFVRHTAKEQGIPIIELPIARCKEQDFKDIPIT